MTRQLLLFVWGVACWRCCRAPDAGAVETPVRKAGLWEMKMLRTGSPLPEMTMQHCTDETTDKAMSTTFSPMSKEVCSKTTSSRPQPVTSPIPSAMSRACR